MAVTKILTNKVNCGNNNTALIVTSNPSDACFAAETDIAQRLRNAGMLVYAIDLNTLLNHIHFNARSFDKVLFHLNRKFARIHRGLNKLVDITPSVKALWSRPEIPKLPMTIDEIRSYKIDGCCVGLAALSSAASCANCTSENTEDYGDIILRSWQMSHFSFYISVLLERFNFSEVYIFNGRHALQRPLIERLSRRDDLVLKVYEFPESYNGYYEFDGRQIFDARFLANELSRAEPGLSDNVGMIYLENSIARIPGTPGARFRLNQRRGADLESYGDYVAFFTSSPDEFFAISDNKAISEDFRNQFEVAEFLASTLFSMGRRLVIRFHPHLAKKHDSWMKEWNFENLEQKYGCEIVYPADPVDSYELIEGAMAVVTCGSTIGIEAAFMRRPVGIIGEGFTCELGYGKKIPLRSQVVGFLENIPYDEKYREAAIRYAAWINTPHRSFRDTERDCRGYFYIRGTPVCRVRFNAGWGV